MREKLRYSWVLVLVGLLGCDLFTPREPEAPVAESGTFLQPDTPERVVENLQAAIAERNAGNYVRSLAEDFAFVPTASAQSRDPALWAGWNRAREEQYFTAMVAAVTPSATPQLQLSNQTASFESESRYVLEATYRLTVPHTRPDAPTIVEGRLVWEIVQQPSGLWALSRWTDRQQGETPSWSDLKRAFVN
ncbi:hypothetical protein [Rhodothermus marinus]|uniref:SnoaL-like domain-containing protein n=1 Tax=Rhodothermus marinus (strain ATCC 43812 / DSM 4252 / R-10) TaxID=518766 RepID=D0MG55_RHOM4|nr:hypothetical protein [Rhodothermus marinus]ACY47611.1 hypothetical protein Rmar_0713 [Rhodothermus marinus DSM 4252]